MFSPTFIYLIVYPAIILGYEVWSEWSACSESCGENGAQLRVRQCTETSPELCTGHNSQKRKCNTMPCKGKTSTKPEISTQTCLTAF